MKHSFSILIISICLVLASACKKNSNPAGNSDNLPPGPFAVAADTTGFDLVLTWEAATDPDNDAVTYSIFLDDEQIQTGLHDTTAILAGLEYETGYSGRVAASDGKGGSSEAGFSFTSREIRIEWEVNLGGSDNDITASIQQTSDGGYLVAGHSNSSDGDVGDNHGRSDIWVVKLDDTGNLLWENNLGGSKLEHGVGAYELADGTVAVFGRTDSDDKDVSDNNGESDYWIVMLSPDGSTILWEQTFGGSGREEAESIALTNDGGFILAGSSMSSDGDAGGNNGGFDYWIVKFDESGSLSWENNFGGSEADIPASIRQTRDSGYIIAGRSFSNDQDVGGNKGESDFWIVKLDSSGNLVWETNIGGAGEDEPKIIQQTEDGGYIAAGYSTSNDQDVGTNQGMEDFWVVKLDGTGNLEWETNAGGSQPEIASAALQTSDGGFMIAGYTKSADGDVSQNRGGADCWLIKLDSDGNLKWEKTFGGSEDDYARSILSTPDGGFIVAGRSQSSDGDVGGNNGENDYWIVKLR